MSEPVINKAVEYQDKLKLFSALHKRSKDFLSSVIFVYASYYQFCQRALLKLEDGTVCEVLAGVRKKPLEFPELRNIGIRSISSSRFIMFLVSYDGHMYLRGSLREDVPDDSFHLVQTCLPQVRKVRCGDYHVTVLTEDSQVFSWGNNVGTKEIGLKGKGYISEPEFVMKDVEDIDSGHRFSAALSNRGSVHIWGTMVYGMLYSNPTELQLDEQVKSICCGQHYVLVLTDSGSLYALGGNKFGQCGVGTFETVEELTKIKNVQAESIYADHHGISSSCVTTEGKILVWGSLRASKERSESKPIPEELDTCTCEAPCSRVYGNKCSLIVVMKEPLRRRDEAASEKTLEAERNTTEKEEENLEKGKRSMRKRSENVLGRSREMIQRKRRATQK